MTSPPSHAFASVRERIFQAISSIRLIDPHTHINPHSPGSRTLADILGYHYYTELVHSAGMPRAEIEEPGIEPRELVRRMVEGLGNITNTANYHWLMQICREFFDFTDDAITRDNWESLFDVSEEKMRSADWAQTVLDKSNVEAVFLTNDFDDDLEGFDASTYIPCLRTDDLVFHLRKSEVRQRLEESSGVALDGSLASLRSALEQRFDHFVSGGARACAISIPPTFHPTLVGDGRAQNALDHVLQNGLQSEPTHVDALSRRIFWTLAELCDQYGLPFDLMIGVNRGVYPGGVYQGQDLYDSRVSLIQYRDLFNTFPGVKFPVSVLASVTNQELVSYSWIFPNVITNGHWWYSNTPSFIHRDASARLEAVPRNKQIGYYSDAYKLEFVHPKFDMYRRILSRILADEFVGENGWSEEKAIELGRQVLRGNVDEIFRSPLVASDEGVSPNVAEALRVGGVSTESTHTDTEAVIAELADDLAFADGSTAAAVVDVQYVDPSELDSDEQLLDPVPSDQEIAAVDIADVIFDDATPVAEAGVVEAEIDSIPLDVGDILGDATENSSAPGDADSQIHMLVGDGEFTPDTESMRLEPDPMTGELHFPVDEAEENKGGESS